MIGNPLRGVALVLALVAGASFAAEPAKFRAGAAISNITPALGGDIVGNFLPIKATNIHDELHARCLVLDDGQSRLAIVVCDLLGMHRAVSDAARKRIEERLGLPPERVLICATHTHSAISALGKDRYSAEPALDEYQEFVVSRIADGVQCAVNRLQPAEIAFGSVQAPEHVFNRRWHLKPGTMPPNPFGELDMVKMNPAAGSADLVEPAGPTDPEISILAVRAADQRPLAVLAVYSLHYVGGVGGGDVSADYFGMFAARLEALLAKGDSRPVAMLANGTSGDINNINFRQPRPGKPPYEQMRTVADDVAEKVHAAYQQLEFREQAALAAAYREVPIATRRPSAEQLAWAKKTLAEKPAVEGRADLPRIYAERFQEMQGLAEVIDLPVQVLRIGDACFGTLPCEVFCEIGLEFKERSALQPAALVSLAHGYFGYLPTPRHHRLGGYETWLGTNRLEPAASDQLLAALLEMSAELKAAEAAK